MFDDMLVAQIRRLNDAWPELVAPVQFAVEDVPPSDPAPWEATPRLGSQSFPAEHGIPPRIVLYRMPLQSHARSRMDLQFAMWCCVLRNCMGAVLRRSTRIGVCDQRTMVMF